MKVTRKIGAILEDLDDQVFSKLSEMMKELEGLEKVARRLNNRKVMSEIMKAHKILDNARMSLD
jgi:hypothetical protein